jgi:site-specific recombinase XerD
MDWQRWIDQLTRQGLSRSSIAQLISLASGIYAWAAAPSRRLVQRNPLRLVELPPNDEKPRMRVALAPEGAALLQRSNPRIGSRTRSLSTQASAARSSTARNGPTYSMATTSLPASTS